VEKNEAHILYSKLSSASLTIFEVIKSKGLDVFYGYIFCLMHIAFLYTKSRQN